MIPVIEFQTKEAGYFKLEAVKMDASGQEISRRVVVDWFRNLITDQGLNRQGDQTDWLTACQVGSGNTAPANTDTSLVTFVAGTSTVTTAVSAAQPSSPYYVAYTITYRFGTGVAAGNLSEIGVGWATSGSTLFSRALILDGGGSPTTITILSDEILDATYQYRVYPPEVDTTGTILISGDSFDYTARASAVTTIRTNFVEGWGSNAGNLNTMSATLGFQGIQTAYSGAIGVITGSPSGSFATASTQSTASYGANNLYREGTVTWDITVTPIGSYMSVRVTFGWCTYQVEFDPVIPKTAINTLSLVFRHSWTRATIP